MRRRIPADVDREDRVLAGLSGRQAAILSGAGLALWTLYVATRGHLPLLAFGLLAVPVGGIAVALALGRADGLSLDRLCRAALSQARAPRRLVQAPEGLASPCGRAARWGKARGVGALPELVRSISADGVLDIGPEGERLVCRASPVSFALRSEAEQEALLGAFGRFLNGLSSPVEIAVSAKRASLGTLAADLEEAAPALPDPGLEVAARGHGEFLRDLDETGAFFVGEVLVVFSAPAGRGAIDQLGRQLDEARSLLVGAGVQIVALSGDDVARTLALDGDPVSPAPPVGSAPGGVVRRKR
ncbi:MAG: PrgI family protein [Acidimicrobiales bacterium]